MSGPEVGKVGATSLTPLYARAKAAAIVPELRFTDPLAADLLDRVGYDPGEVLTDHSNVAGAIHRTLAIDDVTVAFTGANPDAQVVSAGIGLCTRHARLADRIPRTVAWVGIDTDDVIELRRSLLPDDPVALTTGSLASPEWVDAVDPGRATLVVAEGVLMYLDEQGLAAFFTSVREHFGPGTQLVGDYFHPKVAASDRHPIVKATGARFLSGARNGRALAETVSGYQLVAEHLVMERIGLAQRTAARSFTALTRGGRLYAVAHLQVSPGPPQT